MVRKLFAVLGVLLVLGTLGAFVNVARAGDDDQLHHPDLQTLQPSDIKFQRNRTTGEKTLRFSNMVANLGRGRFELRPVNNTATGTTDAYQRIYSHDSSGNWYLADEQLIGTFDFHVGHGHTHFNDFALYELRNVAADGGIGNQVLASSGKVTFCIIDTGLVDSSLEHYSGQGYTSCGQNAIQGLSVGWGDKYSWNISGQSLDVTTVPPGVYWLVSEADPDNIVLEGGGAEESNNVGAVKIRIRPNGVQVLKR